MNKKGQGALEYLLLIGGAVLIAAIVIALVVTFTSTTPTDSRALDALCAAFDEDRCNLDAPASAGDPDGLGACDAANCAWNTDIGACAGVADSATELCVP